MSAAAGWSSRPGSLRPTWHSRTSRMAACWRSRAVRASAGASSAMVRSSISVASTACATATRRRSGLAASDDLLADSAAPSDRHGLAVGDLGAEELGSRDRPDDRVAETLPEQQKGSEDSRHQVQPDRLVDPRHGRDVRGDRAGIPGRGQPWRDLPGDHRVPVGQVRVGDDDHVQRRVRSCRAARTARRMRSRSGAARPRAAPRSIRAGPDPGACHRTTGPSDAAWRSRRAGSGPRSGNSATREPGHASRPIRRPAVGRYGEPADDREHAIERVAIGQASVTRSCQCGTWVAKPRSRTFGSSAIWASGSPWTRKTRRG